MKVKEESEKAGLKLNTQKTKIIASSPITSMQIDGEPVEEFILGWLQNHCRCDCSHEIIRCLLLGRKVMANLDSILKAEVLLCQQGLSSQGYGFSSGHVWMSELDYKES